MQSTHLCGLVQSNVQQLPASPDNRGIVTADIRIERKTQTGSSMQALAVNDSAGSRTIEGGRLHERKFDHVETRLMCTLNRALDPTRVELAGEHQRVAAD